MTCSYTATEANTCTNDNTGGATTMHDPGYLVLPCMILNSAVQCSALGAHLQQACDLGG